MVNMVKIGEKDNCQQIYHFIQGSGILGLKMLSFVCECWAKNSTFLRYTWTELIFSLYHFIKIQFIFFEIILLSSTFPLLALLSILYWAFCVLALSKTYDSLYLDFIRNTFYCKLIFMGSLYLNLFKLYNRVKDLAE